MTKRLILDVSSQNSIIEAIFELIHKHPKNLVCERDGGTPYKTLEGMISLDHLTYMICEVYDNKKELLTKILQFTNGHDNNIASKWSLHVCWGDEVSIEEDLITIRHCEDDGSYHESTLKIFPSNE